MKAIQISQRLWNATCVGLEMRGDGVREAAAIWAGERGPSSCDVVDIVFLDDLPGVQAFALSHRTPRDAARELFRLLRARGLEIVADVHTHPTDWVDLSPVDQAHPIEHRVGLAALVLPHFAKNPVEHSAVGMHEYLGGGIWRRLSVDEMTRALIIGEGQP